jgi:tyrosine-protein kinase
MPAGPPPPNPPELLDSKAMGSLLAALLSSGAEVIIFDAPPLLGLSDASILATKVDGILAVVDIERANKKSVKRMQSLLSQSGSRVLGCVVNKQRRKRKDAAYSYYYYYQAEEVSQSKQNGHFPTVPATPVLPRSPGQQ